MTPISRRRLWSAALVLLGSATASFAQSTGADIYRKACTACHGTDGRGAPRSQVGFRTRLPDFARCSFATAEPDVDWAMTVRLGGPARGLDRTMPAFGDALSTEEIDGVVAYLRGFCASRSWPIGNLNLPRALVTDKAFPENDALVTTTVPTHYTDRVETRLQYEGRLGPRSQYELIVPYTVVKWPGGWNRGVGDISAGFKHAVFDSAARGSIVSGSVEMTFPTGNDLEGLGARLLTLQPSGIYSQILPHNVFVHAQGGMALPLNSEATLNEVFARGAVGATFLEPRGGRGWSPIVELIGSREIEFGEPVRLDLAPELLVTLNRRQHVMASGGFRIPLTVRSRGPSLMASLLWEWSQGSVFSGW